MLEVSVPIAYELLAQCIKQGEALIQRASLVGDFSDYESWKSARRQWIDPTTQALSHMYGGPREARDFTDTVTSPEGGRRWQEQYSADIDCVKQAVELLKLLQGELAFDAQQATADAPAPPERHEEPDATVRSAREQPAASATSAASRVVEPEPEPELERESETEPIVSPSHEEPPAVGAELAPRAPLASSELAQQADVTVPAEHVQTSTPAEHVQTSTPEPTRTARKVLLAHGRDERWKQAVEHLLEQAGTHELTILDERPEERARLFERDEEQQPAATRYAIVLLTADDIGAQRLDSTEEPYFTPRARQEVVFEMGFLVAALSPGRVCVLYEEGVELPCELDGISHVRLDLAGTWQPKLLMKLRRAGFDYDMNRLVSV
jgi:predicted nucleotide-binding protein